MTDSLRTVVIVGASHAGLGAAAELRAGGYEGDIVLIGGEPGLPYHRPHLSKECLLQDTLPAPIRPASFFVERDIRLLSDTTAVAIDRTGRVLHCQDGTVHAYDALILATGALPRALPATVDPEGAALSLRNLADLSGLAAGIEAAGSVAVVGGGLIGLEVAAGLRLRGKGATIVEAAPRLMARSLFRELASHVQARHEAAGVAFRLGAQVTAVTESGLTLADGGIVEADLVLSAIGSLPCIALALEAGLPCRNGILVDGVGRTADPDILALGDCAEWGGTRHECIAATQAQARVLAANLLGLPTPNATPLRLWSTQGKLRLQMCGPVLDQAEIELDETEDGLLLRAVSDGVPVAVQALNAPRAFSGAVAGIGRKMEQSASV